MLMLCLCYVHQITLVKRQEGHLHPGAIPSHAASRETPGCFKSQGIGHKSQVSSRKSLGVGGMSRRLVNPPRCVSQRNGVSNLAAKRACLAGFQHTLCVCFPRPAFLQVPQPSRNAVPVSKNQAHVLKTLNPTLGGLVLPPLPLGTPQITLSLRILLVITVF